MNESNVIMFVKHGSWFMVEDAEGYFKLKALGIPSTRINEDVMDGLKLLARKYGFVLKYKLFKAVRDEFFDKIARQWLKVDHRTLNIKSKRLLFETTKKSAYERAKQKSLPSIETKLRTFFERWGFQTDFHYSESHGKVRMVVNFAFSAITLPVLPLREEPEDLEQSMLDLGTHRIKMSIDARFLFIDIEVKSGLEFKTLNRIKALRQSMSDPTLTLGMLLQAVDTAPTKTRWIVVEAGPESRSSRNLDMAFSFGATKAGRSLGIKPSYGSYQAALEAAALASKQGKVFVAVQLHAERLPAEGPKADMPPPRQEKQPTPEEKPQKKVEPKKVKAASNRDSLGRLIKGRRSPLKIPRKSI